MNLQWLPNQGDVPWSDGRSYTIQDTVWFADGAIVLGRVAMHGKPGDYFVAVYDNEGRRWPGSGARTMPTIDRARDVFDAFVRGRRAA